MTAATSLLSMPDPEMTSHPIRADQIATAMLARGFAQLLCPDAFDDGEDGGGAGSRPIESARSRAADPGRPRS